MNSRFNRTRVVEAAAELADQIGLEQVTITRLAREIGISAPGVYRHITDGNDLVEAIGQVGAAELSTQLASVGNGLSGFDALQAISLRLREWAHKHPGKYGALQMAPRKISRSQDTQSDAAEDLVTTIGLALRAYDLQGEALTDAIRFVRSTLHGFVSLEQVGGFKQPRNVDATFAQIISSLDIALTNWPSKSS